LPRIRNTYIDKVPPHQPRPPCTPSSPARRRHTDRRLVPHEELETARVFAKAKKAAASRRAYNSDWAVFTARVAARGIQPLPASPQAVAAFIAAEAQAGRRAATITRRLTAIRYAHRLARARATHNAEAVRATMRGIRRSIGTAPAKKAPATADLIAAMLATCRTDIRGLRDRALIAFGFASALRRSELVALRVEDLTETFGRTRPVG
jgi:site-specific recombinase XerD